MDRQILRDADKEERVAFQESARHNRFILDAIMEVIEAKIESKRRTLKEEDYSIPHWPSLVADRNGAERAYRDVLNLIEGILKPPKES